MPGFSLTEFKARGLIYGGARPSQFSVDIFPPFQTENAQRIRYLCRAATTPPAILGEIRVPYMGRTAKVVGDREFPSWAVTMYNDDDFTVHTMFEKWSNQMNALVSNRMSEEMYPTAYKSQAVVTQYNKLGDIIRQWELRGLWPSEVASMNLDWEAQNQIQQFDVTFAYDEWAPYENEANGNAEDFTAVLSDDGLES